MDKISKEKRSWNMAQIKSKNTKPEMLVFEELESLELEFEKHYAVVGRPDLAIPKLKIAVFIDGEFWHGKYYSKIEHKLTSFWREKIKNNIKRDKKNRTILRKDGWLVIQLWDDEINKDIKKEIMKILRGIEKQRTLLNLN